MGIAKNFIYNVIYQVLLLILPLITIPYISRVLGSAGIGINAFTNSIVQYFILFGTLGISLYGNREIAYVRDDKIKLCKTFWEITLLKFSTSTIAYLCFLFFLIFADEYYLIYWIQSILIISAALEISWFFMGLEDFQKTVLVNLVVKIIGIILIFTLVNSPDDLWLYVLIMVGSQLLGSLVLWLYIPRYITRVKLKELNIKKHLAPSISLFIPQIAVQVYLVLNKTMLGFLSTPDEVGFFDSADKIVRVILAVVTSLGTVMLPRVSNTFANGDFHLVKNYVEKSFDFTSYLAIPLMFGLAAIATEFAPWFFGQDFYRTGLILVIISPVIIFIAWSNVIGSQYLMPTNKIKIYTRSVVTGAVVNFILNLLLIKQLHSVGTAIATVIAELTVTAVQLYYVRHEFNIKRLFYSSWKYWVSGFLMFIVVKLIGLLFTNAWLTLSMQVMTGGLSYFIILFLLKSKMNKTIFESSLGFLKLKRNR